MKSKDSNFGFRPVLKMVAVLLVPVVAFVLVASAPEIWARKHKSEIPFEIAKMIIEYNSTDEDVGVQVLLDGEPWQMVRLEGPDGRKLLNIRSSGSMRKQGLTELFFESSEPSLDEVSLEEFLARFPEGEYEFEGRTIDGVEIEGVATFTHVIPAGPVIVFPAEDDEVNPEDLVIQWEAVTEKIAGTGGLVIVSYQVIVEGGEPSRRFDVTLPARETDNQVTVPPEFLEPGTEYDFEILAIEQGGNQTITSSSFVTAE